MKVVLFCGGLGLRLRDHADHIPKPMVPIGYRPILWPVMRYFAHFGHKELILCLGYRGDLMKQYFLNYSECVSNDFVVSNGGKSVEPGNCDLHDWRITFVETGLRSNIGQRLLAVQKCLIDEDLFLGNYSDGLTDLDLKNYLAYASDVGGTGPSATTNTAARAATAMVKPAARRALDARLSGRRGCGGTIG
jgi:glucose-1-phosphate cytidylyltransferase